ncbi:3' terminal RNA ribose 2'-O-methyltransferase Hen1 [Viridibacillus sp. YIM B01967]|uniref:Small RNA 2'-O-methyltransferase n=1 Tax=Viridibacillus soli TaxID=2798301 RepID=A0ABS1H9H0_9BACL|nr:3' terminal RNA ribose 2'-O-methyltransferase Hen1 [Viridibacillus soli]MBK3495944.1 3' terminal RNA ribose 2'-O-methyltransferase Hen1 [Viridibacillus soli]
MQLTIKATGNHITELSHLLAKNPNNLYERKQKEHIVRIFYETFNHSELKMTTYVVPDSLALVKNTNNTYDITHYINDREFAVSSIFTSFIRNAFGTALNGQPKEEYIEWVSHRYDFEFSFGPIASELSDAQIQSLFEPLGYKVQIEYGETNYQFNMKERSTARFINIEGNVTLQTGLRQIFVLIPVIDNYKHYFIDETEVEKLERYGEGWLDEHPERELIFKRALRFKELYSPLEKTGLTTLPQKKVRLNDLRYSKIIDAVENLSHKKTVVDFGSGEGKLSEQLGFVDGVQEILAVEPSQIEVQKANRRFEKLVGDSQFVMPTNHFGSLFYKDERLKGKDVIILCEVIEHIDPERLPRAMSVIFNDYQPKTVIITTPNREYNSVYDMDDKKRHNDHRFEWTRREFQQWCANRMENIHYNFKFDGIGEEHPQFGHSTQMCIFTREEESQ